MRAFWTAGIALVLAGCGGGDVSGRYPWLISEDESWHVAREILEAVCDDLEKGNLESFYRRLSLRARGEYRLADLQADYQKRRAEYVQLAKGALLVGIRPPSKDDPYVDMTVRRNDGRREGWRLVYEEDRWRIDRMGQTILELEGVAGGPPHGQVR